jgi:hypothetical protein
LGISTIKFSPKAGFPRHWQENMISNVTSISAIAWGKIVTSPSAGVITTAQDNYGYFLMQEITDDGPSELECITGDTQMWEVKVGKPVSIMLPIEKGQVYTVHVSAGSGSAAIAKGDLCAISAGIYVTESGLSAGNAKGRVIGLPADTGRSDLYVVEIMNV